MTTQPKKPQDHKPKKPETIDITYGEGDTARTVPGKRVTIDGITVDVADEAVTDDEVLRYFALAQAGEPHRMYLILPILLGEEQHKRVMDELRDPVSGRIPAGKSLEFLGELYQELAPNS